MKSITEIMNASKESKKLVKCLSADKIFQIDSIINDVLIADSNQLDIYERYITKYISDNFLELIDKVDKGVIDVSNVGSSTTTSDIYYELVKLYDASWTLTDVQLMVVANELLETIVYIELLLIRYHRSGELRLVVDKLSRLSEITTMRTEYRIVGRLRCKDKRHVVDFNRKWTKEDAERRLSELIKQSEYDIAHKTRKAERLGMIEVGTAYYGDYDLLELEIQSREVSYWSNM